MYIIEYNIERFVLHYLHGQILPFNDWICLQCRKYHRLAYMRYHSACHQKLIAMIDNLEFSHHTWLNHLKTLDPVCLGESVDSASRSPPLPREEMEPRTLTETSEPELDHTSEIDSCLTMAHVDPPYEYKRLHHPCSFRLLHIRHSWTDTDVPTFGLVHRQMLNGSIWSN